MAQHRALGGTQPASAASALFCSLLDVDVRIAGPHVADAWRAAWLGRAHAHRESVAAACSLVAAFGEIRQLDALLRETTASLATCLTSADCDTASGANAVLTSPAVVAAWSAAAARLPAAQAVLVVQAVSNSIEQAESSGLFGDGAQALLAALTETLAAMLAGLHATDATAVVLGRALLALQSRMTTLSSGCDARSAASAAAQARSAMLLRLCTSSCWLAQDCIAQAAENADATACCVTALQTAASVAAGAACATTVSPWLQLERVRAAAARLVWHSVASEDAEDESFANVWASLG
jgi:hypothetical protein